MPITVKIIDKKYVLLQCIGDVGVIDFVNANKNIYSEIDPSFYQFQMVDLSETTRIELSQDDLCKIADQDKLAAESIDHMVIAVVAPRDLGFGFSRVWAAHAENTRVTPAVFRDFSIAKDWIISMREKKT